MIHLATADKRALSALRHCVTGSYRPIDFSSSTAAVPEVATGAEAMGAEGIPADGGGMVRWGPEPSAAIVCFVCKNVGEGGTSVKLVIS